ncbi:hypothetical protein [Candidatus Nitrotoga arctica]|uniref:EF hand n=1 Tax=Candidatus Nitrotoga arctica TaxID=453162 RepID=A0ABN8AJ73_9PROT|nr:hypothetical protein [Candidatus Nitrotoga arctica]CAG9931646.1 EF hand [Candidatus Nitrotoga arctica]
MKKSFNYLAITTCFVLGTSLAHADADSSQGNMHDQMFKAMDSNSDEKVTRDEFNNYGAKKFQQMDANGDGQLSTDEMKAAYKKMMSGENNKMSDRDMGSRKAGSKSGSKMDSANPKSDTKATDSSDNSCCWTPNSGANKSSNKMGGSQDKRMGDTRNKKMDDEDDDDD